jgi:ClpP class serine protease
MKRALQAVLSAQWCITPDYLGLIADIAEREHEYAGNLQALEAKLGRPLGNTMAASVRDGIAMIPIEGPLFKRASFFQAMSGATDYTTTARDLTAALEDPNVKAVMLQIDSPGGEVGGLSDLVAMVRGANKPVWAHIDGTGASAAYWLASAASRVTASATTVVGSVGAMMGMTIKEPKAGEKTYRFISSQSPLKNAGPDTEAGAKRIQALVDDLATVFLNDLAQNRGKTAEFVAENFGQGDVMVASKAVDSGMIDAVSTFEAAFAELKQEINSMDYASLTAQALAENRPDLVAAIRTEALASVEKVDAEAIRTDAIKAERERIVGIEALAMPGAESIVAACKADGTSADQAAVKIVQHLRTTTANKGSAALDNIKAAENSMDKPGASGGQSDLTEEQKAVADMEALRKAGVIR